MLINALTIGLESTLDNNIMADAVMRDKFAQTLTFIFLYFKNFCSLLFPPLLAMMEIQFECCGAF